MNTPVMTAESVMTVPMERSIPAVMMTKVTPRASTPLTAVASRMPTMLSNWRKLGEASEKTTRSTMRAPKASSVCMALERSRLRGPAAGRSAGARGSLMAPPPARPARPRLPVHPPLRAASRRS